MKYLIQILSNLLTATLIYAAVVWQSVIAVSWLKFFTIFGLVVVPFCLLVMLICLFIDPDKVAAECAKVHTGDGWYYFSLLFSVATIAFYVTYGYLGYSIAQVCLLVLGMIGHSFRSVLASKAKPARRELTDAELSVIRKALEKN